MSDDPIEPIQQIQALIDAPGDDLSGAPPFVRGMNLAGVVFKSVVFGRFDLEWTVEAHLTHYDGIVQGGVVNVVDD
jgi:hypothetical protein